MKHGAAFTVWFVMTVSVLPAADAENGDAPPRESPSLRIRATRIIGMTVEDGNGSPVGKITDLPYAADGSIPSVRLLPEGGSSGEPRERYVSVRSLSWTGPFENGLVLSADRTEEPESGWNGRCGSISALVGTTVRQDNVAQATVRDLMIDAVNWKIEYIAISPAGSLGSGSTLYAVPFDGFTFTADSVALHARKNYFRNTVGFDQQNWPAEADPYWTERK